MKDLEESGCDVKRDCDQNAKCESTWVGNQQKYVCQCLSGYSGDGHTCTKLETEVSVINNNIITNWFIWNNIFDTYWIFIHNNNVQCIISNMLKKITTDQQINTVIGCNLIDNCHEHASCKYNHTEGGFRCHCNFERVMMIQWYWFIDKGYILRKLSWVVIFWLINHFR